jgi:hypothetical protein
MARADASGFDLLLTRSPSAYLPPCDMTSRAHQFRKYSPLDMSLYLISLKGDLPAALR